MTARILAGMVLTALLAPLCVVAPRAVAQPATRTSNNAVWTVPVLVVGYFPLTPDGRMIDTNVTTNVGGSLEAMRQKCNRMTRETMAALEAGSRFRAYRNRAARASLRYQIVGAIEYLEPLPRSAKKTGESWLPDYNAIMNRINIRNAVEKLGVKEVWIWGYHSKTLAPWESNMASPHGDISNSDRDAADLPVLKKTYTVYHYNYERDTSEAVHNHIHQIEATMRHYGGELWQTFEGVPGNWRCGNCHFPPNAKQDYDWANKEYVESDIEDWKPEGFGARQRINCEKWNCDSLTWFVYWMRSIPGERNGLIYKGKPLTNWWAWMGDYDAAVGSKMGMVEK